MTLVVVASNVLVRYPVEGSIGALSLADLLTYGAFTYPVAFLVTDLTNRRFGLVAAQKVILAGFLVAVVLSAFLSSPRIAVASASAFLAGQMLDALAFDMLRRSGGWWRAPLLSSLAGSALDTAIFFSLAFAPGFEALGAGDDFAVAAAPLFGLMAPEVPRFVSWAIADFSVKTFFALVMLAPYRGLAAITEPERA
ncbi:VUT family protein [Prosthecomicrobium sp. N25]|uniref:VUT family protein n=1 Tax=Prosthecomicrobium sp. N25 TaxID=3129254 RepID=UPI003076DAAB